MQMTDFFQLPADGSETFAAQHFAAVISIITGFTLTHIVSAWGRAVSSEFKIPTVNFIWSVIGFVWIVQFWWALFGDLRFISDHIFILFLYIIEPLLILFIMYLIVPSGEKNIIGTYMDMGSPHSRNYLLIILLVGSLLLLTEIQDYIDYTINAGLSWQSIFDWQNLLGIIVITVLFGTTAMTSKTWKKYIAVFTLVSLTLYSVLFFKTLNPSP